VKVREIDHVTESHPFEPQTIFTVGDDSIYLERLAAKKLRKLGPCRLENGEPYPGGIAFRTITDAQQYLQEKNLVGYSVYRLAGKWDQDTYDPPVGTYRAINKTLRVTERV
jgi:hypothetical protein